MPDQSSYRTQTLPDLVRLARNREAIPDWRIMNLQALRNYLLEKPETTEGIPFGPEALVFKVLGKMFALVAWDETPVRISWTMINFPRKTAALTWLPLPPLLLSALVHMADPDVNGWEGLGSYSVVFSVALFGVLAVPFVGLCLRTLLGSGWPAFLSTATVLSVCMGLVLTMLGSGATTIVGHARALAGCTGVALGTVLLAVIPASAMGWPRTLFRRNEDIRV